jgi:predicted dehydrogenase
VRDLPAGYDLNAMYVSELRHFLECVEASRETTLPVSDGVEVLRFALAAKDSALGRAMISVR